MQSRSLLPLLFAGVATATIHSSPVAAQTASPRFVDIYEYFTSDAQFEAWYTLTTQLRRNFDDICGDTFCEGDYSNIESLRYRCSVEQATGLIGRCVWVFAGSNEEVDPTTGRIIVQTQAWRCRTPSAPQTTIDALLQALAGDSPLYASLPGTQTSIYDGLTDCL